MRVDSLLGAFLTRACVTLVLAPVVIGGGSSCRRFENCVEHCEGNAKVSCGDEPETEDCGARRCVEAFRSSGPYAVCAIGGPNASCHPDTDESFCTGNVLESCNGELVEVATDCARQGLFCAARRTSGGANIAACVTSLTPSSRCSTDAPPALFCEGDRGARCFGNFAIPAGDCAAEGRRCIEHPPGARCE